MKNKSSQIGVGLALGAAVGTAFGVAAGHMSVWLALGIAIGMVIGVSFRRTGTGCAECAQIHRVHELRNPSNKLAAKS